MTALNAILFIGARYVDRQSIESLLDFLKGGGGSGLCNRMTLTALARTEIPEVMEYIETLASDPSNPQAVTALALLVRPEGITFSGEEPREGERGYSG